MAAVVLTAGVAACGEDRDDAPSAATSDTQAPTSDEPASSEAPGETYPANGTVESILAIDNNFVPQTVTIVAGTEVRWDNNGRNGHNVLPEGDPEATTWGAPVEEFQVGDSYSHVFSTPGTYVYYCSIHGTPKAGMFGTITVTAP